MDECTNLSSSKKGKTLHSGERRIIFRVYNFFKKLSYPSFREALNLNQTAKLCAQACEISEKTVNNICKEAQTLPSEGTSEVIFSTPGKKRKRYSKITGFDEFEKDVLRRIVFSYYDRGVFPTSKKVTRDLQDQLNYAGSVTSTKRLLRKIGFKYRRTNDGRKFLMERNDIVAARIAFLRTMHELRECGDARPIYYLDETWVNEHHTRKFIWQDSTESGGLKVPPGKGKRLIICHVGSANQGFVKECKWVFRSNTSSRDYHDEMNSTSFKEWFITFLNLLEEGSIIIMDNAPYHSVLADKVPSTSWKKGDIQEWLRKKDVKFYNCETKPELLMKVAPFKTQPKKYELDILANEMGHTVIRLPPYHCQYNPIEHIWAKVKGEVATNNKTFKLSDVEVLVHNALDSVTVKDWKSRVRHAEKLQEEDFAKECARSVTMERIVINLAEDSDSDSNTSDSEIDSDYDDSEVLATVLEEEN